MAATVSAWAKPGAWALEAEAQDALDTNKDLSLPATTPDSASDFPSLAAAAAKTSKKKSKKLSLAEFTTGQAVTHGAAKYRAAAAAAADEALVLPTGPRERTAEELERSSGRGFNYSGYGRREESGGGSRWGSGRASDEPRRGNHSEPAPSRADEIDDWAARKAPSAPIGERRERTGGFFGSQSKADESESWISNKDSAPSRMGGGYRERRGGYDSGGGADSESWGRKREGGNGVAGAGSDAESWGNRRNEASGVERPRLVLQPRTVPLENGNVNVQEGVKSKGSNPFGVARPREEVLKEKGQDWKEMDEKLGLLKVRETREPLSSDRKKIFGSRDGPEDRTDRNWRKADSVEAPRPPSSEKVDENVMDK